MDKYLNGDLFFHQNMKIFDSMISLNEIQNYQSQDIYEYLNPDLTYSYDSKKFEGGKMWSYKFEDDPEFKILLKWSKLHNFYVLDFLFDTDSKYDKQTGLKGKYYLET